MNLEDINNNFTDAQYIISKFNTVDNREKILSAGELIVQSIRTGGKIISCGNGGSMSDAMHFAEELTGRFRENRKALPAIAISDPTHLSCTANDYGYDYVFSRFVEALGNEKDILFAISTSGNSQNVINAIKSAKQKGMKIIALTGKDGGKIKDIADIEIRVPHFGYADRIQEVHIKIIHSLIQYIEFKISED